MPTVYIIKNTETDKVYIGSTTQPLSKRMVEHRSRARRGSKAYAIYDEMRRVGIDKFSIYPLVENVPEEELHRTELEAIKSFPYKERLLNTKLGISYSDIAYIVKEYEAGTPIKKIAKDRGHCSKSVSAILKEEGVEIRDWNEEERIKIDDDELKRLYVDERMTTPEIAEIYHTSHQTILKRLKKLGVETRPAKQRKFYAASDW